MTFTSKRSILIGWKKQEGMVVLSSACRRYNNSTSSPMLVSLVVTVLVVLLGQIYIQPCASAGSTASTAESSSSSSSSSSSLARETSGGLNIIHVIVDDLRPELGAYGVQGRHSPNIDALAASGVSFDSAYTQYALCGPSRNSFLSGRRPDASRAWNMKNHFREDHPEWTSLPGMFLLGGRNSYGVGKLYHPFLPPNDDGPKSWSKSALPYKNPCYFEGVSCLPCAGGKAKCSDDGFGPGPVETCWCEVEAVEDVQVVTQAIAYMDAAVEDFMQRNRTFYLGVGLHKPHLPWQASKKHFDLFNISNITLALNKLAPDGMPGIAYASCDSPSPWQPIADNGARAARRAYYAATSGVDEQIGRLLAHLESKGSAVLNHTAVVLHSDHGWHLGEHCEWRKFSNFELTTRVPLIVRTPPGWSSAMAIGTTRISGDDGSGGDGGSSRAAISQGRRVDALVELVDIMPTLHELAALPPLPPGETPLAGTSLVPLLAGRVSELKEAAFSQYARKPHNISRPYAQNGIDHANRTDFVAMGYTVRTRDWRYTEWRWWNGSALAADWVTPRGLWASELYDHRGQAAYPTDFDAPNEEVNLAANETIAAPYSEIIANLSTLLHRQFAPAGPRV